MEDAYYNPKTRATKSMSAHKKRLDKLDSVMKQMLHLQMNRGSVFPEDII